MAWVELLPSGKYRGVYRDAAGRRRSAGTFTHKSRAKRAASACELEARKAAWRDADSFTRPWGEWSVRWREMRVVEASTHRQDTSRLHRHLEPRWENVPIGSITRGDVKRWVADLRRDGVSPANVQRILHLFSASMNAAVDAEVIPANPATRLKLTGGAQAQERFLTRSEYATVRAHLPTAADRLIADVLVYTGMRWGEAAGLHAARLDLARGTLRVVETYDEASNVMKGYPKGKRVRDVPLTDDLVDALDADPRDGVCGVKHAVGRCPGPLVLTTEEGRPLRNSNWTMRVWRPSVLASGVGHVRPHDLRHTFSSWLLQDGISLAEVGRLLGHVSAQTTQRYAHLAETPSAAVLAALQNNDALDAPRKPHVM